MHIYIHTPIYICMYVYFRFCMCMVHVLFNLGLNVSIKAFFLFFVVACNRCLGKLA